MYLAFFRSYTAKQLKSLDPKYLLLCYGAAFIVAFVFIFVETKNRGKIYGPATVSRRDSVYVSLLMVHRFGVGLMSSGISYVL